MWPMRNLSLSVSTLVVSTLVNSLHLTLELNGIHIADSTYAFSLTRNKLSTMNTIQSTNLVNAQIKCGMLCIRYIAQSVVG